MHVRKMARKAPEEPKADGQTDRQKNIAGSFDLYSVCVWVRLGGGKFGSNNSFK